MSDHGRRCAAYIRSWTIATAGVMLLFDIATQSYALVPFQVLAVLALSQFPRLLR